MKKTTEKFIDDSLDDLEQQMDIEVSGWLTDCLYPSIGIDEPANHDKIVDYIVNDVKETADPDDYHSGDFAIAFRRFLENTPIKKYRTES